MATILKAIGFGLLGLWLIGAVAVATNGSYGPLVVTLLVGGVVLVWLRFGPHANDTARVLPTRSRPTPKPSAAGPATEKAMRTPVQYRRALQSSGTATWSDPDPGSRVPQGAPEFCARCGFPRANQPSRMCAVCGATGTVYNPPSRLQLSGRGRMPALYAACLVAGAVFVLFVGSALGRATSPNRPVVSSPVPAAPVAALSTSSPPSVLANVPTVTQVPTEAPTSTSVLPTPTPIPASPTAVPPSPTLPPTPTRLPATSTPVPTATSTNRSATSQPFSGQGGAVQIVSAIGGRPGGTANVTANAPPGATCSITYTTPAGTRSTAQGLGAKTVGATGTVSWTWTIGAATRAGIGTVAVTCGGATATSSISIG